MSATTKIEWASATWNPWEGCTKVSPGCANCYAVARNRRFKLDNWGKGKPRRRTSAINWKLPLRWNRAAHLGGRRARIFPSLCDWLDDEVPIEWLADFLKLIHETPQLDWLLLTKRPENWLKRTRAAWTHSTQGEHDPDFYSWLSDWCVICETPPANVWVGTSVEDQARADERIPRLLNIPARVRFLSMEPLLGTVELNLNTINYDRNCNGPSAVKPSIDGVIVGGESGPGARPCNIEWIRSIVAQCQKSGTACFVKQIGSRPIENIFDARGGYAGFQRFTTTDKKGGDMAEWPAALRVRQLPSIPHPA